jgi:fluoride exporter
MVDASSFQFLSDRLPPQASLIRFRPRIKTRGPSARTMELRPAVLVALGSALGGLIRYLLAGLFTSREFPMGVLAVNVLGCFLIGFLLFGGMAGGWLPLNLRIFLAIGVLGGFTTMSSFTYDTIELLERNALGTAALNVAANVVLSLGATGLGRLLALQIWARPSL